MEASRNITASARSPDGQGPTQATARTPDGERAATLPKARVEALRARGTPARDEEAFRHALASPPGVHCAVTAQIGLRSPWPAGASQVTDMAFMRVHGRTGRACTRPRARMCATFDTCRPFMPPRDT